jgi:hypothetical protein
MSKFDAMKELVVDKTARQVLFTKKHSPKILFGVGVAGVVGGVFLACRATLKVSDILDEHETLREMAVSHGDSEETVQKNVNKLKVKTAGKIAKEYVPAAVILAGSVAALTGSHIILTKRNSAVMAAYAAVQKGYDNYRDRVRQELGEEKDFEFANGVTEIEVSEKTLDGKDKKSKKKTLPEALGGSPYAVMFDERSHKFSKQPGMNAHTLMMEQSWANDKLKARGHLFLNEVYDSLGLPRTPQGSVVGWVYKDKTKHPEHVGDNEVSFGVFANRDKEWAEAFIDGRENTILLDFNVDGMMYDKI